MQPLPAYLPPPQALPTRPPRRRAHPRRPTCASSPAPSPRRAVPRRTALSLLALAPAALLLPPTSSAAAPSAVALLEARLADAAPARPRPDAASLLSDVAYPPAFRGTWLVSSAAAAVDAPAGDALFGAAGALEAARAGVGGPPLEYEARFVAGDGGAVVADRAFNVERIGRAAMGEASVLECVVDGCNRVGVSVRPRAAGGAVFSVAIEVLERRFGGAVGAAGGGGVFYASELVRQSVRRAGDGGRGSVQVKDVQTVCRYEVADGGDEMRGQQRTLVYLVRGDRREREAAGRPVDVRRYDLAYSRRRRRAAQ